MSQDYWNKRFKMYGHTNMRVPVLLAYDQYIRSKKIIGLLSRVDLKIYKNMKILDVGCGTGYMVAMFADLGATIFGFDISNDLIKTTNQRFMNYDNVKLFCGNIQNIGVQENFFDLITSSAVLQHITCDKHLHQSLCNLFALLKPNGYILLFETVFSEQGKNDPVSDVYINKKTRDEWVALFQKVGFTLIIEESYPQAALTFMKNLKKGSDLLKLNNTTNTLIDKVSYDTNHTYSYLIRFILALFIPIDLWLFISFPLTYSQRRFFLLKKN